MDPNLQGASAGTRATSLNRRRAQWFAKVVAMPAAALAITFMPAGQAKEASASRHDVQGKMSYCETCHGYQGRGFHAYNPIPRLAGQQPEYIKAQLQAFVERGRTNNIMYNVSHVMSPDLVSALATNFNQLNPKPIGGGQKDLVPAGKKIFEDGIPSANVPACASCHGTDAKGNGPFPRLAGQLPDYVFNKLTHWSSERGQNPAKPDNSAIMEPIAHSLNEQQIRAVAAYLSYLE